jgi:hypothetical protein
MVVTFPLVLRRALAGNAGTALPTTVVGPSDAIVAALLARVTALAIRVGVTQVGL